MSPTLDYRSNEKEKKEPLTPRARHWIYFLIIVATVVVFVVAYAVIADRHLGTSWGE